MIFYADSSSFIKLYINEEGSETLRAHLPDFHRLASSIIAYAEVRAGFARGRRLGRLTQDEYSEILGRFEADWTESTQVSVDDALVRRAGELAGRYALRGFDSIHLASALTLRQLANEAVAFSSFDDNLRSAAHASGMSIV